MGFFLTWTFTGEQIDSSVLRFVPFFQVEKYSCTSTYELHVLLQWVNFLYFTEKYCAQVTSISDGEKSFSKKLVGSISTKCFFDIHNIISYMIRFPVYRDWGWCMWKYSQDSIWFLGRYVSKVQRSDSPYDLLWRVQEHNYTSLVFFINFKVKKKVS